MKSTSIKFNNLEEMKKDLDLKKLNPQKTLIQVFSGLTSKSEIEQIQTIFKEKNNELSYIGTTTAGEICNGKVFENSITVSITSFEHTKVQYSFINQNDDFKMGAKIAKTMFKKKTKALLIFADGLQINGSELLEGISSVNTKIPVAGGLAGDNENFVKTYVFNKDSIFTKGVVAAALNSDVLNVFTDYQLNWQPIGKHMTITKAIKNRLYEIDGINASEIYTKYLGSNIGNNLPYSAIEFPIIKIDDDGLEVCRSFNKQFSDGSLLTIGNIEVGDHVRFAFGNIELVLKNTINQIQDYKKYQPEVIFTYSCTARKSFFQSQIKNELIPLENIAPTSGFFTYGEIFHNNNKNSLLNVSLTILGISENKIDQSLEISEERKSKKSFITDKHYLALNALTNLSNKVIDELEEAKNKLKEQAMKDYLTNLYNRRYFDEIAKELLELSKRSKEDFTVMVLDLDKFKTINDTYGHTIGDEVIKTFAKLLISNTRTSDITARLGGEEFAILLPRTTKDETVLLAENLRKKVESHTINIYNKEIKFTVSIGVAIVELKKDKQISEALNKADTALYKAKRNGRNRIEIYS